MVEELGERSSAACGVGGGELGGGITVVAVVLGEDGGEILEDKGGEMKSKKAGLESSDDGSEDTGRVGQKELVVAGDFCPPGIDVGAEGESKKVVELCLEFQRNI
jgi:hypothetical protein